MVDREHPTPPVPFAGRPMSHGRPAAANHMIGARRAGASWEELHVVAEIVTALGALGPGNQIGNLIKTARTRVENEDRGQ